MSEVYRPVGYGPPPTVDELIAHEHGLGAWLGRTKDDSRRIILGHGDGEGVLLARFHVGETDCDVDVYCEWCAIGSDGFPCAIGTPPEIERERLLREAVKQARRIHARPWDAPFHVIHNAVFDASMAYLEHIIATEEPTR